MNDRFVESIGAQYTSTYSTVFMVGMDSATIPLQNIVASLGMVEIDTTKIYDNK